MWQVQVYSQVSENMCNGDLCKPYVILLYVLIIDMNFFVDLQENTEKIKVNKTLPYLVSNVIEVGLSTTLELQNYRKHIDPKLFQMLLNENQKIKSEIEAESSDQRQTKQKHKKSDRKCPR